MQNNTRFGIKIKSPVKIDRPMYMKFWSVILRYDNLCESHRLTVLETRNAEVFLLTNYTALHD